MLGVPREERRDTIEIINNTNNVNSIINMENRTTTTSTSIRASLSTAIWKMNSLTKKIAIKQLKNESDGIRIKINKDPPHWSIYKRQSNERKISTL